MVCVTVAFSILLVAQVAVSPTAPSPMTNGDVAALVSAHVPDAAVLLAIRGGAVKFDFSAPALQDLKQRGVSDVVLQEMRRAALQQDSTAAAVREPAGANAALLTNETVVEMLKAGLSEDVVVMSIETSQAADLDTRPSSLIDLQRRGVPSTVLKAMLAKPKRPSVSESGNGQTGYTNTPNVSASPDARLRETLQSLEQELTNLQSERAKIASELRTIETNAKLTSSLCNNSTITGSLNCFTAGLNNSATVSKQQRMAALDASIQDVQVKLNALRAAAASGTSNLDILLDSLAPPAATVRIDDSYSNTSPPGFLHVYRVYKFNQSMGNPTVSCDGQDLAVLRKGFFFTARLAPGNHKCSMRGIAAKQEIVTSLYVESGQQYFLAFVAGATDHTGVLSPVSLPDATKGVSKTKPIQKDDIKAESIVSAAPPIFR